MSPNPSSHPIINTTTTLLTSRVGCLVYCYFLLVVSASLLPTTITNGTYTSMDGTIPSGGTTLVVPSMLADANSTGKTEASCELIRTTFNGTLTIDLPTTPAAWDTIPLRLLVQDGISSSNSSMWPSTYIVVKGVLALGSNITVFGGSYDFTNKFVFASAALTIQDGSTFAVVGGAYRVHYPGGLSQSLLWSNQGNLTILNMSTFLISKNNMVVSNGSVSGSWTMTLLQFTRAPVKVEATSSLTITDNSVSCSDVTVSGALTTYILSTGTTSPIIVSTTSTLAITHNHMSVWNVSVGSNLYLFTLFTNEAYSPTTVIANSSLSVSNNKVAVSNVSVGSRLRITTFFADYAPVTVSVSSSFTVINNHVVGDGGVMSYFYWYALEMTTSPITVDSGSDLGIANNSLDVLNMLVTQGGIIHTSYVYDSLISIQGVGSTITVENNNVVLFNMTANGLSLYSLYIYLSPMVLLTSASTFSIANNSVSASNVTVSTGWSLYTLYINFSPTTIDTSSTLSIARNSVTASNVTVGGSWSLYTFYSIFSPILVNTSSTLLITDNSVTVSSANLASWNVYTLYSVTSISSFNMISASSTLSIAHNSITTLSVTMNANWNLHTLAISGLPTIVDTSSILSISNNSVSASNVTVGSSWSLLTLYTINSPTTVSASSTLSISNNSVSASNVTVDSSWSLYTIYTFTFSPITISTSGTLSIANNNINALDVIVVVSWLLCTINLLSPAAIVNTSSALSISNNIVTASNVSTGNRWFVNIVDSIVSSPLTINASATLIITNNTIRAVESGDTSSVVTISLLSASGVIWTMDGILEVVGNEIELSSGFTLSGSPTMFGVGNGAMLGGTGDLYFNNNSIRVGSGGTVVSVSSSSTLGTPSIPSIHTCDNYVNGQCVMLLNGDYSCATGFTQTGVLAACASTPTATPATPSTPSSTAAPASPAGPNTISPPTPLSDAEQTAIAVVAITSADLKTVAAIGMLRCTPGSDEDVESEAGIRALVPVALSGTCAGAVQGALLSIGVACLLSVVAMCVVKTIKKSLSWVEAAAMVRCPSIVIAVWAFMQMGLVVCGARLVTAEDDTDGGLGVVGVMVGALLPAVCVGLARGVVSRRCYRLAQVPEAVAGRHWIVVWARSAFLPSYELDVTTYPVSKAFSTVVGWTRRPSCLWAGLPVIQPVVMLLVVFVKGELCSVFLILAGVAMLLVGALCHVLFRPHRLLASNYLQGVAMALNAAMLFIASKLVGDPLNIAALDANAAIAMIQVALSVCRFAHTASYLAYMRLYGKTTLVVCGADGSLAPIPTPVFDIQCKLCAKPIMTDDVYADMLLPVVSNAPTTHPNIQQQSSAPSSPTTSATPQTVRQLPSKSNKKAWNPKEYVPMKRPYTTLYEDDPVPSDEKDDDMHLEMDNLSHSIELDDDDDGDNDDNLKSQESDNSIIL